MQSLTLDEVAEATAGAIVGAAETAVTSVSTDTRTLAPGALFVALRGERHDGHDYVALARERGAAALLVERTVHGVDLPHVVVGDGLEAYGDLARYYRDTLDLPVVGVTGSVGKTTTKEMIAHVLGAAYSVQKSAANFNNEIGVPQTIFGLTEEHTVLVLEMGMRGAGQITRLAEIAHPTVGVVTNIGLSHVELLGSQEAIAEAKGELLAALPPDGTAVLNGDDPMIARLRSRFGGETLICSVAGKGEVVASDLAPHENGWRFTVSSPWGERQMFLPNPGRFNVANALLAVAVGGRLGVSLDAIARALAGWTAPAMRLEILRTPGGVTILSDVYNAAPASMTGALETLRDVLVTGKRVAVLGEMRELGDFAPEAHREVGRAAAGTLPDLLVLVGPLAEAIGEGARAAGYPADRIRAFPSTEIVVDVLPTIVAAGDAVLVKGSRALEMERIVVALGADEAAHA